MKYLHIIPPSSRMLTTYVGFIREHFCADDCHHFLSIRKVPSGEKAFFEQDDMLELKGKGWRKVFNLNKLVRQYDRIIWYSFIVPHRYALYLSLHPLACKKSVWIVWGMDLHNWKLESASLVDRAKNLAHKLARKRFKYVVCLDEADRKKYIADFGEKPCCICANLPLSKQSLEELEGMRQAGQRLNGKTFIQIEHNAHSFNRHHDIIDSLSAVDDESFEYYIPLSYGTKKDWAGNPEDYKEQVIIHAEERFGARSHPILSMMPTKTYTRMLWNMDIAIFGSERQNGLGNILRMLYVGNKVYLPKENPTYKFLKEIGCDVSATDDIPSMTREEFLRPVSEESISLVCDWIMRSYYPDNLVHMWQHVFKVVQGIETAQEYEAVAHSGGFVVKRPIPSSANPDRKESRLNLKPYIWEKKNRAKCNYAYIIGSDQTSISMINVAMHLRSGLYVRGILSDESTNAVDGIASYYCGTLSRHFPFEEGDIAIIADNDPSKRKQVFEQLEQQNADLRPIVAASSMVGPDVFIGDGCLLAQWSTIDCEVVLGKGVYVGCYSHIGSSVSIGDWSIVGDGTYVGKGVSIGQNVIIGAKCLIADGAVIKNGTSVPFGSVVK